MKKIIFNSSLPRSGSTLFQNILAQNKNIYTSHTSGLIELLYAARKNYTTSDEFKLIPDRYYDKAWTLFCRYAMEGFYEGLTSNSICVDKSRSWMYYFDWLKQFYPNPKLIVCIRDLRSILSSMEKMNRKNAHLDFNGDVPKNMNFITIEQRVSHWMATYPVGLSVNRLKNAIQKGDDKHFHFVIYEEFVKNPDAAMKDVYNYIDEPYFQHDFLNIKQALVENDLIHGIYGDHKIKPVLSEIKSDWNDILGSELSKLVVTNNKWFYDKFYPDAQ